MYVIFDSKYRFDIIFIRENIIQWDEHILFIQLKDS